MGLGLIQAGFGFGFGLGLGLELGLGLGCSVSLTLGPSLSRSVLAGSASNCAQVSTPSASSFRCLSLPTPGSEPTWLRLGLRLGFGLGPGSPPLAMSHGVVGCIAGGGSQGKSQGGASQGQSLPFPPHPGQRADLLLCKSARRLLAPDGVLTIRLGVPRRKPSEQPVGPDAHGSRAAWLGLG